MRVRLGEPLGGAELLGPGSLWEGSAIPLRRSWELTALLGATLIGVTMVLLATGLDATSAFGGAFACLNNIGPALGVLGPSRNYAALTDFQTWVCTFAMLAGRLELLTVFVLLTPAFWRR